MSFLADGLPAPAPTTRSRARARLRQAMDRERSRTRRRLRRRRWVVAGTVTLLVLGSSPPGLEGELQPLLGLADAVASTPAPLEPVPRHWYTRAETIELVSVPVSLDEDVELQFLVTTVEETWHDMGDVPRKSLTFGAPKFMSSEDEDAFYAAGLAMTYREGNTVSVPVSRDHYRFAEVLAQADPDDIRDTLRRRVAGLGDRRMDEVQLLRLTADMIQLHADDPLMRAQILRVIADIPGIMVVASADTVSVFIDYFDGDLPLRLMYTFDAGSAQLVGEYLAVLATQSEPASVLRRTERSLPTPLGVAES